VDVDSICRICAEGWRDTYAGLRTDDEIEDVISRFYSPERVRRELEPSGREWGGWIVAEDKDGDVVAAGAGGMTTPTAGEIFVLYVAPSRRREGAGSAVLRALTARQLTHGAREQWVSVEEGNAKGIPFYEHHGFMLAGKRAAYEMSGLSLRYVRTLTPAPDQTN
jgi:ribosomal protein S18 acetylase RimI-like enzyme